MTRDQEIAWAAGLFEGEGYVHVTNNGGINVGLNMNDEDVVKRFALVIGRGKVRIHDPANSNHQRQHRWRVTSWVDFTYVTDLLYPLLGDRQQFIIDLARDARPANWGPQGRQKTHCKRGHGFTQANTEWKKQSGGREGFARGCRACARERRRVTA